MEEVAICPNCGNENRTEAKFCKNCGFNMTISDSPEKSPVKFCPKCKNPNRSSAKFCSVCGHSFIELTFVGPLSPGTILVNRYEIISLIKSGGMGAVYRARDHRMLEIVAIKELIGDTSKPEKKEYHVKRFNEEGKILATLEHPNLPRVTDLFIERGRYYLVMEFIDGEDLDTFIKKNKSLSQENVIKYAVQILDILDYLHNQNPPIIYRDIKPANIMIRSRDERPMLIDFGIARTLQNEEEKRTKVGTPQYSPMEQFKGMVETRSDIYSLGVTMHHLVTGVAPAPMAFKFDPITKIKPELDKNLESVIIKATQSAPEDRYQTARDMKEDLTGTGEKKKTLVAVSEKKEIKKEKKPVIESIEIPEKKKLETIKTSGESKSKKKEKISPKKKSAPPESTTKMALIPKGYFWMGDKDCEYDEKRKGNVEINRKGQHRVLIPYEYYIDITPVTNSQYKDFVDATGYASQGSWEKAFKPGKEDLPVVNLTWNDASAYAEWAGKRLPTEAEWEKASRGGDGRIWPWGNIWDENKLNSKEKGPGHKTAVSTYDKGASPYGVLDTVGNVWEWTADWYLPYPYEGPYTKKEGDTKVIRGGSYRDGKDKCQCSSRMGGYPENKSSFRGFRCAKDSE